MGQPGTLKAYHPDKIGKRTRGTETSQYPQEKKTKVIAQVVASERALAQTTSVQAVVGL